MRGVSLEIPDGQIVGILGPNGAGKTTTIRMITGLMPPSAGLVSIDGMDSVRDSRALRRKIGYMPESSPLYPEMRVESYLRYRAGLYELARKDRKPAVERVIEKCWLKEARSRRIGTLSKGFRQRVGLAAALLHDPPVVILDEPTSGLDPAQVVETRSLIRELSGRRTMLLVSHILPEVERTCDRIVVFARGKVRADGAPADIAKASSGPRRVIVEFDASKSGDGVPAVLSGLPGVQSSIVEPLEGGWSRCTLAFGDRSAGDDPRAGVFAACAAGGLRAREIRGDAPSLEEFYIRLVERADAPETGVAPA